MITNQIDVSAVLVTIEGLNANLKKPGVAMYISMNSQNPNYKMEQFVVRKGCRQGQVARGLKGKKLMSAPGPANLNTAKGILAKAGLKEGDYTIDQLDMGQHVNAMKAGTFDGGYTLEPSATIMQQDRRRQDARGRRDRQIRPGRSEGQCLCRRAAPSPPTSSSKRPDVAKRFAAAWAKASTSSTRIRQRGAQASRQEHLHARRRRRYGADARLHHGQGPEPEAASDYLQKFIDFGAEIGVVPEKVDVTKYLKSF